MLDGRLRVLGLLVVRLGHPRHCSTLINLMSKRLKQVSLFLDAAQSTSSEVIDFHIWFPPGFLMQ